MSTTAHSKVAVTADDPAAEVGSDEWNAGHSTALPDSAVGEQPTRTVLAATERLTAAGASHYIVDDILSTFNGTYMLGTFSVLNDRYQLQYKRTTLSGNARATLAGNGELFMFDLAPVGRLILAGRGL